MTSVKTFRNTITGVVVKTTHLYSKWLTFDRTIKYVVKAIKAGTPDENGVIELAYVSDVKSTTPYRIIKLQPHWTPGQWLYVTDIPANLAQGLVTVRFENPYMLDKQAATLYRDKKTGMVYEVGTPYGWDGKIFNP